MLPDPSWLPPPPNGHAWTPMGRNTYRLTMGKMSLAATSAGCGAEVLGDRTAYQPTPRQGAISPADMQEMVAYVSRGEVTWTT